RSRTLFVPEKRRGAARIRRGRSLAREARPRPWYGARMEMTFAPEHRAFREQVRAFLREAMPPHLRAKAEVDAHFTQQEIMEWHRILHRKGWIAPHWPKEHGGPGLDATSRFLLAEELELSGAP